MGKKNLHMAQTTHLASFGPILVAIALISPLRPFETLLFFHPHSRRCGAAQHHLGPSVLILASGIVTERNR